MRSLSKLWRPSIARFFSARQSSVANRQEKVATAAARASVFLLLLLMIGATEVCWAHAILMDSTPKLNATVNSPELNINLRFNVRIDGGRSRVRLVAPDGTSSTLPLASQSSPNTLQSHVAGLKPGAYKLQWQVLASDGHMSHGEIPFTVN